MFFGVSTTKDCGPESNLDLVQFCWDYAERFSSIKYAIMILPKFCFKLPFGISLIKTICIQYYRARSDGWKDKVNCITCTSQYKATLKPLVHCPIPAACRCNICLRQPPSLHDAASHVLFRHVYNIQHLLRFGSSTTFNEYVYAYVRGGWMRRGYSLLNFHAYESVVLPTRLTPRTTISLVHVKVCGTT